MKKDLTELVFILDCSGSMAGLEADTIGGFNSLIAKQQKTPGEAYVSTVLFNQNRRVIHDRVNIQDVSPMTEETYTVCGSTALLDAVGSAVHHIGNIHKYARPEDVPEKTMFIITTDGMENSSREYSLQKVKSMIERQKEKYNWDFLFLGANMDAVSVAGRFGISPEHSVTYVADREGTALNYDVLSDAVSMRRCCSAPIPSDWKERIERDAKRSRH